MMIADMIREARTEQEVFQLLNAYIETGRCGGKPGYLAEDTAALPSCANDVTQRCLALMGGLDAASKQLDDTACQAFREALHIFTNALHRLKLLEYWKYRPSVDHLRVHDGMRNVARGLSGAANRPEIRT